MNKQQKIYQDLENLCKEDDYWGHKDPAYEAKSQQNILFLLGYVTRGKATLTKLRPLKILEVGCAQGNLTKRLVELGHKVTAIDVSKSEVKRARKNAPGAVYKVCSLEDMSNTRRFDIIICAEVLYYILDHKKALAKLQSLGDYLICSNFITYFPIVAWRAFPYELALRKFPLIKILFETDIKHGMLVVKSLRKLKEGY